MMDDAFSDFLRFLRAQSVMTGGLRAGGAWAVRFNPPAKIKVFALIKGTCWLVQEGSGAPRRIDAGEVFLLVAPRAFTIASDLDATPVEAREVFADRADNIATYGDGADQFLIGGHVALDPDCGPLLLDVLPPYIHLPAAASQAVVARWVLDQLVREGAGSLPGAGLASTQLAQLLFVQVLRYHLESAGPLEPGLLRALTDRRLGPALQLMHGNPGHNWQLDELARAAGMSRTTFTVHFKSAAGVPPLTYLSNWRMRLARRALREGDTPIAILAQTLGYTSESAFSNAFKRHTGTAPRSYRNSANVPSLTRELPHQGGDLVRLGVQREVPRI